MATNSIAADAASLDALRRSAASDPSGSVKQAANEFEALFARQLLKSMRDAMPKSGLFDGPGKRMFEDLLDDQLARSMSGQAGGLGDMLSRHLSRYMGESTETGGASVNGQSARLSPGAGLQTRSAGSGRAIAMTDTGSDSRVQIASLPDALQQAIQGGQLPGSPASPSNRTNSTALSVAVSRTPAQPASIEGVSPGPLSTSRTAFVDRLWPHARQAESATGVPAAFVVGQAALESGWGRGEIRHPDGRSAHNLFGIKATADWPGDTVKVRTTEYENGQRVSRVEEFRAYASYGDAFKDWVGLMTRLPRYAGVLTGANSPQQFANGLQQAGYATDPNYGSKLERVIKQTIAIQQASNG